IAPDHQRLRHTLQRAGCAIVGQSAELAPADRRLYAIRDVTATVESVPLITASILSKKLAAGLHGLVMDVKCGNGAFAAARGMADALAHSIVAVAQGAGLPTSALITDMNQVLGHSAGNALEVQEAIDYLCGSTPREARLHAVTLALASELLVLGGLAAHTDQARQQLQAVLDNGAAAECFAKMVAALGGPHDLLQRPGAYLPAAPLVLPVPAPRSGTLVAMQTRALGLAVVELGGGRRQAADAIDPRVGLRAVCALGSVLQEGQALAWVHGADAASAARAVQQVQGACSIVAAHGPWQAPDCVLAHIDGRAGAA
ncbi:MAG: thymidine phosphorylase, partial [Rhodoferax sp.]